MALELSYLSVNRVRRDKKGSEVDSPSTGGYNAVAELKKDLVNLREAIDAPNLLQAVKTKLRQEVAEKRAALVEAKRRKKIERKYEPIILGSKGLSSMKRVR
jgi:hypothetical protein